MIALIALTILAAIILVAGFAALDAHRWQARQRPPDAPLEMPKRRTMPTGLTMIVKQIDEREKR